MLPSRIAVRSEGSGHFPPAGRSALLARGDALVEGVEDALEPPRHLVRALLRVLQQRGARPPVDLRQALAPRNGGSGSQWGSGWTGGVSESGRNRVSQPVRNSFEHHQHTTKTAKNTYYALLLPSV